MTKESFFGMNIGKIVIGTTPDYTLRGTLKSVDISGKYITCYVENDETHEQDSFLIENCSIVSRPLSAMTEEEKEKLNEICEDGKCAMEGIDIELTSKNKRVGRNGKYRVNVFVPHKKIFYYLISIGVNIFEGVVPEDWYTYEKGESK